MGYFCCIEIKAVELVFKFQALAPGIGLPDGRYFIGLAGILLLV